MRQHVQFSFVLLFALTRFATPAQSAVTFDWAVVGNPSNAGDPLWWGTIGGVDHVFRISKYEVTNLQYTEFLNAVAATDTFGLYSDLMGSTTWGGITRSGEEGAYTYAVKSDVEGQGPGGTAYTYSEKPVVFVSFFDAMRFVNWLQNGQPTGMQSPATTEDGVYKINDGLSETRSSSALFFIPSEDEWHKAAFHKNDGVTGNYWDYATSNDAPPNNNLPSADTGNSANMSRIGGGLTTGNYLYPLTDVGAYKLSESPYGTYDQCGNVLEWHEGIVDSKWRGVRGGEWSSYAPGKIRFVDFPSSERFHLGFRVASVPEPSTLLLFTLATCVMLARRERQRFAALRASTALACDSF